VHDVDVVTGFEPDEIAAGLSSAGSTCFLLTNTHSLSEAKAVEPNTRIGRMLFDLAVRLDAPIDVVRRSDSTLRGHVIAEVRAPDAVRRRSSPLAHGRVWRRPALITSCCIGKRSRLRWCSGCAGTRPHTSQKASSWRRLVRKARSQAASRAAGRPSAAQSSRSAHQAARAANSGSA
jgi:hypothetical protein